jgi:hypothetical protein
LSAYSFKVQKRAKKDKSIIFSKDSGGLPKKLGFFSELKSVEKDPNNLSKKLLAQNVDDRY